MDMKSSQGPVRALIGSWTSPGTTSVRTKENKMRVTIKVEVPISTGFAVGEAKNVLL